MRRTVEPELMEDDAQALAYAEADFSDTDDHWVALFIERFGALRGRAIDLGCGPGNMAVRLARACPDLRVLGVDGSEAMLARAPTEERVTWRRALIPDPTLPTGFDAVVSNSLLHHLHDPMGLWHTVAHCGKPGAAVLIGDLRRPATPEEADRLTRTYAADAPEVLRRDFHASLHAAFEVDEVRAQVREAGLELDVEPLGDRHLLVVGRIA